MYTRNHACNRFDSVSVALQQWVGRGRIAYCSECHAAKCCANLMAQIAVGACSSSPPQVAYITSMLLVYFFQHSAYTLCLKKGSRLTFDDNFGKCGPIFKSLSPTDSWENSLSTDTQRLLPHLRYVATLPCDSRKCENVTDFDSILNKLLQCS